MRAESRDQLPSIGAEEFDQSVPPWEKLTDEARETKMELAHSELLRVLDRAGYEVRKKGQPTN